MTLCDPNSKFFSLWYINHFHRPAEESLEILGVAAGLDLWHVVKSILDNGAEVDFQDGLCRTALMRAASFRLEERVGPVETVGFLLKSGASVDIRDKYGQTALFTASIRGLPSVVALLLEYGPSIETTCSKGYTPLMVASSWGSHAVVEQLLDAGANASILSPAGETLLELAACRHQPQSKSQRSTLELLIARGADINAKGRTDRTPLQTAARYSSLEAAKLLLKAGADPGQRDTGGFPALHIAVLTLEIKLINILLSANVDADITDSYERSALHIAVSWKDDPGERTVSSDSEHEHNLKAGKFAFRFDTPNFEVTRLKDYTEIRLGHLKWQLATEILKRLLQAKPNLEVRDNDRMTALDIAREKSSSDFVKLLEEAGAH